MSRARNISTQDNRVALEAVSGNGVRDPYRDEGVQPWAEARTFAHSDGIIPSRSGESENPSDHALEATPTPFSWTPFPSWSTHLHLRAGLVPGLVHLQGVLRLRHFIHRL